MPRARNRVNLGHPIKHKVAKIVETKSAKQAKFDEEHAKWHEEAVKRMNEKPKKKSKK